MIRYCHLVTLLPVDGFYQKNEFLFLFSTEQQEAENLGYDVAKTLHAAERCGTEIVFVTEDLTLDFSGGSLRLFAPVLPGSRNCGLAALMSAGEYDILIPGDMPAAAERVLADTHSLPQVEVLVVGHHGAASSTAPELLQTVSPEIAVISVGADNSYGHPAQAVLDRLTEAGAAVYRTDQAGDITITR